MPIISENKYRPPFWLFYSHLETIYPALFRKIDLPVAPERCTVITRDGDFIELDYYNIKSDKTVIISHGLEGDSRRPYVLGMARIFLLNGWNAVAWNYRGCSGKVNNSIKSYHSGFTQDLEVVVSFAEKYEIRSIALTGFSLGGNLTLRYLADCILPDLITAAVVISVPLDLHKSCDEISRSHNFIYSKRFLRTLKRKVREKAQVFPEISTEHLAKVRDLKTFDDYYTAPMHGFRDALDYYHSCSALHVLDKINKPTLIINALNDPFLPASCYPHRLIENNKFVHLQTPKRGGHVGFSQKNGSEFYWSEKRAMEFVESVT
jgi:hypothetical protein